MFSMTHLILGPWRPRLLPKGHDEVVSVLTLSSSITWEWTLSIPSAGGDVAHSSPVSIWTRFSNQFAEDARVGRLLRQGQCQPCLFWCNLLDSKHLIGRTQWMGLKGFSWQDREWHSVGVKWGWLVCRWERSCHLPSQRRTMSSGGEQHVAGRHKERPLSAVRFATPQGCAGRPHSKVLGTAATLAATFGFYLLGIILVIFLLPDTRASSGQPATKLAWSLEGRAVGKRLCWHGLGTLGTVQRSAPRLCPCTCGAALGWEHGVGAAATATRTGPARDRGLRGKDKAHRRVCFGTTTALVLLKIGFGPQLPLIFFLFLTQSWNNSHSLSVLCCQPLTLSAGKPLEAQ